MGECIIRNILTNFSERLKIKITSHIHQNSFPSLSFSPILKVTPHQKENTAKEHLPKKRTKLHKSGHPNTSFGWDTHQLINWPWTWSQTPPVPRHTVPMPKPWHGPGGEKKQTFSQPERGTQLMRRKVMGWNCAFYCVLSPSKKEMMNISYCNEQVFSKIL